MNILFINNDDFINGVAQTASFCGHSCRVWNQTAPLYKVAGQFKTDMIISSIVNNEIIAYLKNNVNILSVFYDKDVVKKVFNVYIPEKRLAANFFDGHYPFIKDKKFVVSTNSSKTEQSENLLKGFLDVNSELPLKLFSNDNWPGEYYCGPISNTNMSVISNLCWFYLHIGDFNQSFYNAILCNSVVLTTQDYSILPKINSYEDIIKHIKRLNSHPQEYELIQKQSYEYVIKNDTYFHRLSEILNYFGIQHNTLDKMKELL